MPRVTRIKPVHNYVVTDVGGIEPARFFERRKDATAWIEWRLGHEPRKAYTLYPVSKPTVFLGTEAADDVMALLQDALVEAERQP